MNWNLCVGLYQKKTSLEMCKKETGVESGLYKAFTSKVNRDDLRRKTAYRALWKDIFMCQYKYQLQFNAFAAINAVSLITPTMASRHISRT